MTAIIGQNAEIPCELTPHTKTDNAYLVLWWYKDIFGTPIYRYVTNLLDYLTPQKNILKLKNQIHLKKNCTETRKNKNLPYFIGMY